MVMAQLTVKSLLLLEERDLNPVIGNIYLLLTVCIKYENKEKSPLKAHYKVINECT